MFDFNADLFVKLFSQLWIAPGVAPEQSSELLDAPTLECQRRATQPKHSA